MTAGTEMSSPGADRQWFIVGRWQEYEGEARANLLRLLGIALFYLVEWIDYRGLRLGPLEMPPVVGPDFHRAVTALAVAWAMVALGVFLCRSQRVLPSSLKYLSTACDVVFLTAILVVADGPRSPLVVGYFLVVVLAALRFSLPLVRFATAAAAGGYLFLLGHARWIEESRRVPRYQQAIVLLALVLTGVILGQVVRRVRRLAEEYARRLYQQEGKP
jgi:hypothetical protein